MKLLLTPFITLSFMLVVLNVPAIADYNVSISNSASSGGAWSGGSPDVWTPSATGATVSVAEIQARLATKGVTITTAGGGAENGDLTIGTPITWDANTLNLTANRDVQINAVLKANNASLAMTTTSGTVRTGFAQGGGFAGRVDFFQADGTTPRSGSGFLTINGSGYTVITSLGAQGSTSGADLQGMQGALSTNYALGANIDATATRYWNSGTGFAPIGKGTTPFTGIFDGLGHTVGRLRINRSSATGNNYAGLFGYASGAILRNVGLEWGLVSGSSTADNYSGGLAGSVSGSISNSYSTGTVFGSSSVSDSTGNLVSNYSGGLTGSVTGSISNSYSTGTVSGSSRRSGSTARNYSGGLAGDMSGGSISNSYSTASVSGSGTALNYSGGLAGDMSSGSISNSYSTASVTGSEYNSYLGGLAGQGSISNSYSSGSVIGNGSYVGGLTGAVGATNSFWDTQTSGMTTSASGTGKTTLEMQTAATFISAGWDQNIWLLRDGYYPQLKVFNPVVTTPVNSIVIDPAAPATVYSAIDGSGIFKSIDSGATWSAATSQPANKRIKALVIKPGESAKLFAASYGGGVFKSINAGVDWTACANTNLTNLNLLSLKIDPSGKLFAGTEGGVFVSNDSCASWIPMSSGLP